MTNVVQTGQEKLFDQSFSLIQGKKVGLIVNPTSVSQDLEHLALRLKAHPGTELAAVFGPEHGMWGAEQDMIAVQGETDPFLDVPVYSLYGDNVDSLRPPPGSLDGLDVLVYDVQDVGSRYYTYIYTMMLAMEEAAKANVTFVTLDRPNPIGGVAVDGNVIREGFSSFVGLHPLANQHGMTAGELAFFFKDERHIDVDLHVVTMDGWTRDMYFEDAGIPWVMPSPNMPTVDTAIVYPGMCLLEGTNLSEGRGSTRPFELFGAPYLDGYKYAKALQGENIPGAQFRPMWFRPTFQKHGGLLCGGAQLHVSNRREFSSLHAGVAALVHARALAPDGFQWRSDAYEFVDAVPAIDLLFGEAQAREAIDKGATSREVLSLLTHGREAFDEKRAQYLLYGGSS